MGSTKSSRPIENPAKSKDKSFIWAIVALIVIAALVFGFVFWQGKGAKSKKYADYKQTDISTSVKLDGDSIVLGDPAKGKTAELFEDYSCPHCAELAQQTDGQMLDAIKAGKLNVKLRPLTFLDNQGGQSNKDGNSHRALAALLVLAERGEGQAWWNLRDNVLNDQKDIYNNWKDGDFANAAKELGASDTAVKDIKDGKDKDKAEELSKNNADYLNKQIGQVSSPHVLVDGKDVPSQSLSTWVSDVTK